MALWIELRHRLALVLLLALPAPVASADELLPDVEQHAPANISSSYAGGEFRVGFGSQVTNVGAGPLEIHGTGPGNAPMQADQLVSNPVSTTPTVYENVGELHYYVGGGHEHFHLMPFSRYRLVPVDNPGSPVLDVKQGFCLAAMAVPYSCGLNQPELTELTEGLDVDDTDVYAPYLEGQYIPVTRVSAPDGLYELVHETNWDHQLHESDYTNDAASVLLRLTWPEDPASLTPPALAVLKTCPDSGSCPPDAVAPPAPPPPPPAEVVVATPPPPPPAAVPASVLTMSRGAAIELSKQALRRELKGARRVRAACARVRSAAFSCRVASSKGRGRVGVWYFLEGAGLRWRYNIDAGDLHRRRVDGGERLAAVASQGGALVCRLIS